MIRPVEGVKGWGYVQGLVDFGGEGEARRGGGGVVGSYVITY